MIELPEAHTIAGQLNITLSGKRAAGIIPQHTPHKLAWYYGEPSKYSALLAGKTVEEARSYGGLVEIKAGNVNILFGDGVNVRFHARGETRPARHQLLIEFEDGSALSAVIQMYGGVGCFIEGELENSYYKAAQEKPSPLSGAFDEVYFERMLSAQEVQKLSLKGLLATEQRIPGLGNGVLQDILFNAGMHPKKKVTTVADGDKGALFRAIKDTLAAMASAGGRDRNLISSAARGYKTILSRNSVNKPVRYAAL
jgi:formamidopyrimidine-DNA glycosylase